MRDSPHADVDGRVSRSNATIRVRSSRERRSSNRNPQGRARVLIVACALLACVVAQAGNPSVAMHAHRTTPAISRTWVWSGTAEIALNPDALAALGVRVSEAAFALARVEGVPGVRYETASFAADAHAGLEILREGARVTGIGDGALRFRGGFVFAVGDTTVDLRGFVLRSNPRARVGVELADTHGEVWLTADHAHYGFDADDPAQFAMRHMNLRIAPHFARALGRDDLAGQPVGTLAFTAAARSDDASAVPAGAACSAPWPGGGLNADIQLMYSNLSGFYDSVYAPRCGLPPLPNGGACTAASTNGKLVIGADASLRNAGQTAIAWYEHFSGDHAPYGNDQHPYLVWNLYRIDANGRIKQIGASGVKHAFYSVNENCGCAGGNVLWPGCEDVYSLSSNDNGGGVATQNLGPRSEIVPSTGLWGRCGSTWDANCDGQMDAGGGAQDLYEFRLQASESDLLPPLSTGARYYFEYWYVARDDTDIYNSMAYREIAPRKTGANWSVPLVAEGGPSHDFFAGPALSRWVDAASPPANTLNRELATPLGRARVAVKATALGNGQWRYEYAVMNFDYAHARLDPAHASGPNLKVLSNHGFARFSVPLPTGATMSALRFDDLDTSTANDWTASVAAGAVTWSAPASGNTLDWGSLYHFEFVTGVAPAANVLTLVGAATASEGERSYTLALLGPGLGDRIFANGFD